MSDGARLNGLIGPSTGPTRIAAEDARGLLDSDPTAVGTLTRNLPLSLRSRSSTGKRLRSFFDDWYNRIHVVPRLIEYGVVAQDITRPLTVWNAYLGNSTINSLLLLSGSNITIGGPSLPLVLKQFEAATFSVTAAGEGSATIQSNVRFTFGDRADTPLVPITGTRARLFDFRPNWKESVSVRLEYRTDIFTSRSGREQRRALRGDARKVLEFTVSIYADKLRSFQRLMAKWQSRPVTMGDPTRHVPVRKVVPPGSNVVRVDDLPEWLTPGTTVLLEDGDTRELAVIGSIDVIDVQLLSPLENGYPLGTVVRPVVSGLLDANLSATHLNDNVAEVPITLAVDPGSEPVFVTDTGMFIHGGREVFAHPPDWGQSVTSSFAWPRETVDFGFGRIENYAPTNFGVLTRQSAFLNRTAAQAREMEGFFNRAKGQRGEFYWPTGTNDLPLVNGLISGTDYLRAIGTEIHDEFADDTVYRAVQVLTKDDRRLFRTVVGMVTDTGNTIVQFDEPWLFDEPADNIAMVSWLTAARFASDQFSAEWITNEVMQTQLATQTLEDLTVENPVADYDGAAQWALEAWGVESLWAFDRFDWLVNVLYAAIWFIPEAWVARGERDADRFDWLVNERYPEIW